MQTPLDGEEKSILSRWQRGDELLYQKYLKILQERVKQYGVKRMEQVNLFVISIPALLYNIIVYLTKF